MSGRKGRGWYPGTVKHPPLRQLTCITTSHPNRPILNNSSTGTQSQSHPSKCCPVLDELPLGGSARELVRSQQTEYSKANGIYNASQNLTMSILHSLCANSHCLSSDPTPQQLKQQNRRRRPPLPRKQNPRPRKLLAVQRTP